MSSETLTVTVGAGKNRPRGKRLDIAVNGSPARALAETISALPSVQESWWTGHLFKGDYRAGENWEGCGVASSDIDYLKVVGGKHKHATPPNEAVDRIRQAARAGRLHGNVVHLTPHGLRVAFLLEHPVTEPHLMKAVLAGAAELLRKTLEAEGLSARGADGELRDGYAVDVGASCDIARLFYAPRATVNGKPRAFAAKALREEPYSIIDLFKAAPEDEAEAEEIEEAEEESSPRRKPGKDFLSAVEAFNRDNPGSWPEKPGTCPACGHHDCFTQTPDDASRWYCFSTGHGACGLKGTKGWHGDALDIEAHLSGLSRYEVLLRDHYLEPSAQHQTYQEPRQEEPTPKEPHGATAADWEMPVPLGAFPLPRFPVEAFPPVLESYISDLARETQTPPELGGGLVLTTTGATSAKKFRIRVRPGWEEPLNLYGATILPPGERKSATFAAATEPLEVYERREFARLAPEIQGALAEHKLLEKEYEATVRKAANAEGPKQAEFRTVALEIAARLDQHIIPVSPRLVCDDVTPERLSTLLALHGGRMAVFSAEGDLFSILGGRYAANRGPSFAVFLKGHSGDTLRVDRGGRPPEYVERPALSVGLTVQPGVIRGLAATPEFRKQGLLARFLYSWPESLLGRRDTDPESIRATVRMGYESMMESLLNIPFSVGQNGRPEPRYLTLSHEAREMVIDFLGWIEPQLGPEGALAHLSDWAGKLAGAAVRIAGNLHLATYAHQEALRQTPINETTMLNARTIAECYLAHARKVFSEMGADAATEDARKVLAWALRTDRERFTQTEAHQALRSTFPRADDVPPALTLLEKHGYLREEARDPKKGPGRTASPAYLVNPHSRNSL